MSAHTIPHPEPDWADEIVQKIVDEAWATGRQPSELFAERLRLERTRSIVSAVMSLQGIQPDPVQVDYQWDRDEAEYGQEWCKI